MFWLILICATYFIYKICIYSAKRGPQGTPCAIETPLGWSLLGPSLSPSKLSNWTVNFIDKGKQPIEAMVENMWASEFDPGTSMLDAPTSGEDHAAYDTLKSSVCVSDGHYQLPLLWKIGYSNQLSNNLDMAQRRLISLKRRLEKINELKSKYTDIINTYLAKGYARPVPQSETNADTYLAKGYTRPVPNQKLTQTPTLPKVTPDQFPNQKPTQTLWVMFGIYLTIQYLMQTNRERWRLSSTAAKYNRLSMNDTLMKGPYLTNNLTGVLTQFRKERFTLVADIEAMFYQVRVDSAHVDSFRFLWWKMVTCSKYLLHTKCWFISSARHLPLVAQISACDKPL